MTVREAVLTRRSVRAFVPGAVPEAELRLMMEAASRAPSGGNAQAWYFLGVRDPRRLAALRALSPGLIGVPAAAVALCERLDDPDEAAQAERSSQRGSRLLDLGAAMQNLLLSAHELGWGACAVGSFDPAAVGALLKLPRELSARLLVALGPAAGTAKAPRRKRDEEIFGFEVYQE